MQKRPCASVLACPFTHKLSPCVKRRVLAVCMGCVRYYDGTVSARFQCSPKTTRECWKLYHDSRPQLIIDEIETEGERE